MWISGVEEALPGGRWSSGRVVRAWWPTGSAVVLLVVVLSALWDGGEGLDEGSSPPLPRQQQSPPLASDILARYPGQDDYISPTRQVWAAAGGAADLPCNLTSPVSRDSPRLVLWYKQGVHKPIYSYDMRNGPATHWKSPDHLGLRATFEAARNALNILRVQTPDEGIYRCRVDFRINPTLTFISNLSVIVPPRRLLVYIDPDTEVRGVVGPFLEGETVTLNCRAEGGSPPPSVTWWEGAVLLDMTSEEETSEQVTNTLVVTSLTRRDLHRPLTCQASNTNLTRPLQTTVTINMSFPPLWVRILGDRAPLSAGRPYDLQCQIVGAKPPAAVTWRLQNSVLGGHRDEVSQEGNVTYSELRWTPSVKDAGKVISCQADSPVLEAGPMVDDWRLQIYYVPMTRLRPGRSLNLSNIEEGDDVYFECSIRANPWVYKISWLHEGQELEHNVAAGVIISNQSLVLQRVTRTASGNYYCVASNTEGDGHSNPILLKVKYVPVCRGGQTVYHGVAKYEQVNIPCRLDAHPKPLAFRWTFNNSGESVDIPATHYQVSGWESTVSYTPHTELDYGTLLCWGSNAVGRQRQPCVFHVFPAGRPDPVHNCSAYNLTVSVVNVRCVAGFDGGLPQTFVLELYEPRSNRLLANVTNKVPTFAVPGLASGVAFMGVIYSTNEKGRGEMVSLQVYTVKDMPERPLAAVKPPPPRGKSSLPLNLNSIIAMVVGGVGGLLVVGVIVCAVVRLRLERGAVVGGGGGRPGVGGCGRGGEGDMKSSMEEVGVAQGASPLLMPPPATTLKDLPPPPSSSPTDQDEKNPDVIPHSDADSWHIEGVNTISSSTLATGYATLPRTAHLYSHPATFQQACVGGSSAHYTELFLPGAAAAPPHHCHQPQRVLYAAFEQRARYPAPQQQHHSSAYQHTLPASSTPTLHHHHHPHHTPAGHPQAAQQPIWTPSATAIVRRHSLRRDPYTSDHEATVPLIASQKESSV
ncbi:protein turtle homolog A isoform X1 [Procambarus clarkii]|uniref:protein turtle homolog A isoform X1 n=1 Tax=Procambarus clarkii TaxID=6728 RepID=UPI00374346E9